MAQKDFKATYTRIADAGVSLDRKSRANHLNSLREGIVEFKEMAGLA